MNDGVEELYEHAACGLVCTELDGTVVRANSTFLAWTGLSEDEVVGRKWPTLLAPGARIYYETHYAPLLQMQGFVREIAVEVVGAGGARLAALVNSTLRDKQVHTAVFPAGDRREYERELLRERERAAVLAATLQQTFVPPAPPSVPGLDVAGVYRPAGAGDEVGGDFYDVFATAANDWGVVIGDVCGKGAEAAVVTALARYTVRATAMQTPDPSFVLGTLNTALLAADSGRFCTVAYGRLYRTDGPWTLTVSAGGHPLPLLLRADGSVTSVGRPGSLLGVLSADDMLLPSDAVVGFGPGDCVVFFTDGVTEARASGAGEDFYGEHRLRALLAASAGLGLDAAGLAARVVEEVLAFQGEVAQDDIAVVVVRNLTV